MGSDSLNPLDVRTEDFETYLYKWGQELAPGSGDVITGPGAVEVDGLGGMPIYNRIEGPGDVVGAVYDLEKDGTGVKVYGKVIEGSLDGATLALEGRITYLPGTGRLVITSLLITGIGLVSKGKGS